MDFECLYNDFKGNNLLLPDFKGRSFVRLLEEDETSADNILDSMDMQPKLGKSNSCVLLNI